MNTLYGKKVGMTRIYDDSGKAVAVTILSVHEISVKRIKTEDTDKYQAIQVDVGKGKLKEVPFEAEVKVGDKFKADSFAPGDTVVVSAVSKGKGFAGTVKRHNFKTGPKSHGSHNYRKIGSIGTMYPEHVIKGKRMPGRMGSDKVTIKNLKVVQIVPEKDLILVSGAVPGPNKGLVTLRKTS